MFGKTPFPIPFFVALWVAHSQFISFDLLMASYFDKEEDEDDLQTSLQYLMRRGLSLVANNPINV